MKKQLYAAGLSIILLIACIPVCAGAVLSDITTNREIEILLNGSPIPLVNKPFIGNAEVYVPLREFCEKIGLDPENNLILWDNGTVALYLEGHQDDYELYIGQPRIKYDAKAPTVNALAVRDTENYPVLVNDLTYIPFSYIDYIFNRFNHYYPVSYRY